MKFDIRWQISPRRLQTVAALPGELWSVIFSTIIFIHSSNYIDYYWIKCIPTVANLQHSWNHTCWLTCKENNGLVDSIIFVSRCQHSTRTFLYTVNKNYVCISQDTVWVNFSLVVVNVTNAHCQISQNYVFQKI